MRGRAVMKKSKKHEEIAPSKDAADRVRHLLQQHWAGNQNQMARDVGCSQSSLSRVVRGESQPGKRLLKLIADFGVDPDWIFHGRGEPGLGKTQTEVAFALPVTQTLLAGPATEHPDRIQGQQFPVAAALYQPSRCWYELPDRAAILWHPEAHLAPRDLLLLEYDLRRFESVFEMDGKTVVAWVESQSFRQERHLEIGRLEYTSGPDEASLTLATGAPEHVRWKGVKHVRAHAVMKDRKTGQKIQLGRTTVPVVKDRQGRLHAVPDSGMQSIDYRIDRPDIVAVCVGMFRR